MAFHLIDMDTWERREHYYYYKDFLKVRYNLNIQWTLQSFWRR
mgnify:CR=1 FL=1